MRCHWLAVAVLGACQFSSGQPATSDGSTGSADAPDIDAPALIDAPLTSPDASPDALVLPGKVRSITVTAGKVQGGPHTDFPLLVSLSGTWLKSAGNGGDVVATAGTDIYFSSDQLGVTRLAYDVEVYDPVAGTLLAWVKVPALASTTVLYIHYGDPAITTSQENVTGTWSASYSLVSHMDGSSDATGLNTVTSTGLTTATGQIGPARSFDGSTSYVSFGSAAEIDDLFTGGGTLEAWYYAVTYGGSSWGRIFDKNNIILLMDNANTSASVSFYQEFSTQYGQWNTPAITNPLSTWHQIVVTYDNGSVNNDPSMYVDGTLVNETELFTPSGTFVTDGADTLYAGTRSDGNRKFNGILDELRMSTVQRGSDWILTQYRNQADPASFYTVSAPL
jgi:hypothetical protein